ncbi:MAG: NAD-dependent epimerase/dehydratase family protein [Planktothrix sp.]|uniref:NAD-dependent epimerase/dehydratase family protein n=1 Tax=Planktothrix sp. TaxID=3088171 RepID=UPI0038D44573
MKKRIFITGASGCIGHYIAEKLIQNTEHELFLLVRNPEQLGFDYKDRSNIHILQGDLRDINQFKDLLSTINIAILIATAWGGYQEVLEINVKANLELVKLLNPDICEQILYFSTASILDQNNKLLPEAGEIGTDYIRTKYECLQELLQITSNIPPLRVLFPTLVLGGEQNKPYSHLSSGISDVVKWINLIRWFQADASFHFIHAADIAAVVYYLVNHPPISPETEQFVLGNPEITLNQAVETACEYYQKPIYFRLNLSPRLANFFIWLFKIQMAEWDRFCLNYRHFTYQNPVHPAVYDLPGYCSTFTDVLKLSQVKN